MNPERWQRIEALLDGALDLDPAERGAFLERECAGDADLLAEVRAILEAGERSDPVLDGSAAKLGAPLVADSIPVPPLPQRVGPYRVERLIGEGGMGSVYLAQRADGEFDQRVALKLVRTGLHLDSRIVRRFRDERQMLAALNHPAIARLLDGGLTEDGLPFFAMEYVDGLSIDRYCDAHDLGIEQRLTLFAQVCDAVAHAHGKQIVHRDIKPSNILVTADGTPRLLDFGIAKLLIADDGGPPALTRRSERLLTPEYASPEQIRGEPVVVASDVYCLGVLLYELLTGERPFSRSERTTHELERAVLEDDPTRPSEVVQREVLRRRLKGDIDTIILTAMNKEPARRYASAAEIAADVRRHLSGQAVLARGTSGVYRARRWVRRYRAVVAGAVAVAVTAAVAIIATQASHTERLVPGVAARIPFEPEFALDAELTTDGKRIAFVAGTGTAMQLYVTDAGSDRARPIAPQVPGLHRWPRWSADGERIALSAGSRIYLVNVSDGSSKLFVEPDSGAAYVAFPAWSPNGQEFAYVQDGALLVRPVTGGPVRRLAATPNVPHSLQWSPDGRFIAVVTGNIEFVMGTHPWVSIANVGNAGPTAVWIVPVGGGEARRITDALSLNTSPVWLPQSRGLLFISSRDGGRDVYRVALDDDGNPVGDVQRVTTGLGAHTISITGDGHTLAYSVFRVVANIWSVVAPDSGDRAIGEATPVTRGTQSVEGLALSADGKWLAFDSDRHGRHHIYIVPSDGGEAKQLTSGAADEFMPHWSPNAREIAYHAFTREAARRLQVVSADGGPVSTVVTAPRNQRRPSWSPDGSALVFDVAETASSGDLYLIERTPSGSWGQSRRLTTNGVAGRWSPDGREILYVRRDGIWATTRDGGAGRHILRTDATVQPRLGNAEWSRDGASILFKRYDGEGRTSFWSVSATGGEPRLMVRLDRELRSHRPEFATDGRRFVFTVTERVSDIWTMELLDAR